MTCKAVRDETMPVLWESLFIQPGGSGPYQREPDNLPIGLGYTKFWFTGFEVPGERPFWKKLPRVVMVVSYGPLSNIQELHNPEENHVRIYKRVSAATVFTILNTPLRHRVLDHLYCGLPRHMVGADPRFLKSLLEMDPPRAIPACRQQQVQRLVRPMATIRKVILESGAAIHAHSPSHLKRPTTSPLLRNTELVAEAGVSDVNHSSTALELMKLAGLQTRASHLRDVESRLLEESRLAKAGKEMCRYQPVYADWHLRLTMDVAAALGFAQRLNTEVDSVPAMLKNRLHITITGIIDAMDLHAVTGSLLQTFKRKIPSPFQFFPSKAIPQQVMACQAVTRTEFPDDLVAIGAPRFLNTPIIGTITMISKNGRVYLGGEINADHPEDVVRAYEREHFGI